jgi:hypothetical protein
MQANPGLGINLGIARKYTIFAKYYYFNRA